MAVLAILIPGLLVFSSGFAGCPSAAGLFIGVRRLPLCWSFHQGSQMPLVAIERQRGLPNSRLRVQRDGPSLHLAPARGHGKQVPCLSHVWLTVAPRRRPKLMAQGGSRRRLCPPPFCTRQHGSGPMPMLAFWRPTTLGGSLRTPAKRPAGPRGISIASTAAWLVLGNAKPSFHFLSKYSKLD